MAARVGAGNDGSGSASAGSSGASTSAFPPGLGAGCASPSPAGAAPSDFGSGVLSRTHVTVCPIELVHTTAFFPVKRYVPPLFGAAAAALQNPLAAWNPPDPAGVNPLGVTK